MGSAGIVAASLRLLPCASLQWGECILELLPPAGEASIDRQGSTSGRIWVGGGLSRPLALCPRRCDGRQPWNPCHVLRSPIASQLRPQPAPRSPVEPGRPVQRRVALQGVMVLPLDATRRPKQVPEAAVVPRSPVCIRAAVRLGATRRRLSGREAATVAERRAQVLAARCQELGF